MYLRNVLIEGNRLTGQDDVRIMGTGGIDNVKVEGNFGGNRLIHSAGVSFSQNEFVSTTQTNVNFTYNPRPQVVLSGLDDRITLPPGSNVEISATVTHGQEIASVEFWSNGNLLGSSAIEPYTLKLQDLQAGTRHNIFAKATDVNGRTNWTMLSIAFEVREAQSVQPIAAKDLTLVIEETGVTVQFEGNATMLYSLQYSVDLNDWQTVSGPINGIDGTMQIIHPGSQATEESATFYRVITEPQK